MERFKMLKLEMLLGATKEDGLLFAEVSYRGVQDNPYFSVSFNYVTPVVMSESEVESRTESLLDCYDTEYKYELCERFDCSPRNLFDELLGNLDMEDLIDNSLYPEVFSIDGVEGDIYFDSDSCGQCGSLCLDVVEFTHSKKLIDKVHEFWKEYHLKHIDAILAGALIQELMVLAPEMDEETWIKNWLTATYR